MEAGVRGNPGPGLSLIGAHVPAAPTPVLTVRSHPSGYPDTLAVVPDKDARSWFLGVRVLKSNRPWLLALGLAAGFALCVALSVAFTREAHGVATVWMANGFLALGFLRLSRPWSAVLAGVCLTLNIACNMIAGDAAGPAVAYSLLNLGEAAATAWVIHRLLGPSLKFRSGWPLVALIAGALVAPTLLSAGLATLASRLVFGAAPGSIFIDWFLGDLSGLGVVMPALLLTLNGRRSAGARCGPVETSALMALVAGATALVFVQHSFPVPFVVFIALLIMAFRAGPRDVAVAGVMVALISVVGTLAGDGPLATVDRDMSYRIHVAQIYTLAAVYSAMAVATVASRRQRLQRLLERREQVTRAARRRAVEASEAKTRFLASMSHEIRTPMNSIIGFTRLLLDTPGLPPEVLRRLALIDSAGASLMMVVDDILDFSKVEAGQIELDLAPVSPRSLAEDALAMVAPSAAQKGLDLSMTVEGPVDQALMADGMRLRQVLLNLLNNAVKFTAAGRVILAVRVEPGDHVDTLRVSVTDTGSGIPLDRRDRLFVRFSQVDATVSRKHGGTGLGLAICKGLVELMDGEIGVKSEVGQGSMFWFELPLSRAEAQPDAGLTAATPQTDLEDFAAHVLLVDDNAMNRELGGALLEVLGCRHDAVDSGEAAVEAARSGVYDAILMDLHMPGMDGLAATRAIRTLPGQAGRTPIIAMTADVLPEQVARCLDAGMAGHVAKPIRPEALARALQAALLPAESEPEAISAAG